MIRTSDATRPGNERVSPMPGVRWSSRSCRAPRPGASPAENGLHIRWMSVKGQRPWDSNLQCRPMVRENAGALQPPQDSVGKFARTRLVNVVTSGYGDESALGDEPCDLHE